MMDYEGLNYFRCNVEQALRLTAESDRGDAAGFWGGGVGMTRCRTDKGLQGPCIP
jgi:hypothetical protein